MLSQAPLPQSQDKTMKISPGWKTPMQASTPSERMESLCAFLSMWCDTTFSCSDLERWQLKSLRLPTPLKTLYAFGGDSLCNLLNHQDCLYCFRELKYRDGLVIFASENQVIWRCATLPYGDDPPVWHNGDLD